MSQAKVDNYKKNKANRQKMTKQQYRTIKRQAVSGKVLDARKGLQKVLKRRNGA